jgi:methionine aminopeptidase
LNSLSISTLLLGFPTLPFATRSIQNEKLCCLGLSECLRHELLEAYPVLTERSGEFVAQFQFTVMLLPGGAKRVTGLPFAQDAITKSSFSITDPTLLSLLAVNSVF